MAVIFTNTPNDYAPLFEPVSYTISNSGNSHVNAEIITTDLPNPVGIKRLPAATSCSFNIAGYLRRLLNPTPFNQNNFGFFSDKGRFVTAAVKCDSAISPVKTFVGATSTLHENQLLSDLAITRSISWNDNDEISILVPDASLYYSIKLFGSKTLSFSSSEYVAARGIVSLCISMPFLRDQLAKNGYSYNNFSSLSISISNAAKQLASINYNIIPASDSDIRLCWFNKFGAIDYFSFSQPYDSTFSVLKDRFLNHDGFAVASISASTQHRVSSGFLPHNTLSAVAHILCSPRVWLANNNSFTPVDILSDNLHFAPLSTNSVDFSFRLSKPQVCQNF